MRSFGLADFGRDEALAVAEGLNQALCIAYLLRLVAGTDQGGVGRVDHDHVLQADGRDGAILGVEYVSEPSISTTAPR